MKKSSTVCVDANIVVRTVLFREAALQRLWKSWRMDDVQFFAPTLLQYEIANSLYQYHKHGDLSSEAVQLALEAALAIPFTLVGDAELHKHACALAEKYHLPAAYDAHYLALAERLDVDLWTVDARLVKSLQPFAIDWVKLAGN